MSVMSDDESSDDFSDISQFTGRGRDNDLDETKSDEFKLSHSSKSTNVAINLTNRQLYGRFCKNPKAKTERVFNNVHHKCRIGLSALIGDQDLLNHVFMGFTVCGQYFISFVEKTREDISDFPIHFNFHYDYELFLWRFVPGERLKFVSKHRIFTHFRGCAAISKFTFIQYPMDPYKLICYGLSMTSPAMVHMTIMTLPFPKSCRHCNINLPNDDAVKLGWCSKHGFILHYMFSMAQPCPSFDPNMALAYPDHIVINTGHYIHILNLRTSDPVPNPVTLPNLVPKEEDTKLLGQLVGSSNFNDTLSEVSESTSEYFGTNSVVDAILEDFNEYDLEGNECNKPFHELNISCEPLNVTGKSYHNTLVQNIVDPRIKRLQNTEKDYLFSVPQSSGLQKPAEKNKIDKKIAEKAYEFIEENEKCEKLSSFRKKRLAEKKYEFSEDNSENIVPFNSLRRERRLMYKSQNRVIRSSDFNCLFLSPRSPMQSPNSRTGQFSPGGARNLYCPLLRYSPHHSKSPISPKEPARKFYAYSPSLDSDCSDSDSRLILRIPYNYATSHPPSGLLIVDPKTESPKWIKKVVRRYSNGDFENGSLLSGQSRDDYNIPIEIPLVVQTLGEQHLDVVPDFQTRQLTEMQLIVSQRTFDCEQFMERRAQKVCFESQLEYLYCQDYDIKLNYICPVNGNIMCQAVIKIGAVKSIEPYTKPETYTTHCSFIWNIVTDSFRVVEPSDEFKLQPIDKQKNMPPVDTPKRFCNRVLVMDFLSKTKTSLRDFNNYYEICFTTDHVSSEDSFSDSD